jgi:hypothetical protein
MKNRSARGDTNSFLRVRQIYVKELMTWGWYRGIGPLEFNCKCFDCLFNLNLSCFLEIDRQSELAQNVCKPNVQLYICKTQILYF